MLFHCSSIHWPNTTRVSLVVLLWLNYDLGFSFPPPDVFTNILENRRPLKWRRYQLWMVRRKVNKWFKFLPDDQKMSWLTVQQINVVASNEFIKFIVAAKWLWCLILFSSVSYSLFSVCQRSLQRFSSLSSCNKVKLIGIWKIKITPVGLLSLSETAGIAQPSSVISGSRSEASIQFTKLWGIIATCFLNFGQIHVCLMLRDWLTPGWLNKNLCCSGWEVASLPGWKKYLALAINNVEAVKHSCNLATKKGEWEKQLSPGAHWADNCSAVLLKEWTGRLFFPVVCLWLRGRETSAGLQGRQIRGWESWLC